MNQLAGSFSAGDVVEFFDSGSLKLGLVRGENRNRLQILDQNGRERSIPLKQITVKHDAFRSDRAAFSAHAAELTREIERLQDEVDSELLWESVHSSSNIALSTLSEIYFGETSPVRESAILRALLADSLRFKWRGDRFELRTPEQVAERLDAEHRHRERVARKEHVIEWMRQLVQSEGDADPPPDDLEEILLRIEKYLILGQKDSISDWLAEVDRDLTPKAVAFDVLAAAGRLPKEADPFLVATGINPRFPDEVLQAANRVAPFVSDPKRRDYTGREVFSIDDEDTREIDDALSLEAREDFYRVGVHIADLTKFVNKSDHLDQEAARRSTSIYLPHHTIRMFPERISCDLASLRENELRPTLSFEADFSLNGELVDWRIVPGQIRVAHRLNYDEADRMISEGGEDSPATVLNCLSRLANRLMEERVKAGALILRRPELKITVRDDEVAFKVLDFRSPSRQLVSEFMILCNRLAAEFAIEHSVPLIFRSQPKPEESPASPDDYDPVVLDRIFAQLEPSRLSLTPQPHYALGLKAYVQLTSPIRRYTDLTLQRQMIAHLSSRSLPYTQDEMMEVLGSVQSVERDIKSVERKANRQFTLRFMAKHFQQEILRATVVRSLARGYLVETDPLYVRGKLDSELEFHPGDRLNVRIERVHPEKNVLVFTPHPGSA